MSNVVFLSIKENDSYSIIKGDGRLLEFYF